MTDEDQKTYLAAIELLGEFKKLSATESMELAMYVVILKLVEEVGGISEMRARLNCVFDECRESVRNKKGRKSKNVIALAKELGIA